MKIRIIGSSGKDKNKLNEVVKNLECKADIIELPAIDKTKYNIKYTPAIIIENVVVSEGQELSMNELYDVVYQFIEAY